jgi:hypothetical protein
VWDRHSKWAAAAADVVVIVLLVAGAAAATAAASIAVYLITFLQIRMGYFPMLFKFNFRIRGYSLDVHTKLAMQKTWTIGDEYNGFDVGYVSCLVLCIKKTYYRTQW